MSEGGRQGGREARRGGGVEMVRWWERVEPSGVLWL